MELIVSHPSGAKIVEDYLANDDAVLPYFRRHFSSLAAFRDKSDEVDGRFDAAARRAAVEALTVPEGADPGRLDAFVEEGGFMVTTGQQPGLYGGPMYSLYKGLTAVRLAEAIEQRLGRPVIPVFWVGSEDHDWAEANHADLIGTDNELRRYEVLAPGGDATPSLQRIELGADADERLAEFIAALPDTDFSAEYVGLLREGFGEGGTIPGGFHALMQKLLGRFGLFFTDATAGAVKAGSSGLLLEELGRAEEMERVLQEASGALVEQGYDIQAPILEGGVNVFLEGPAGRERLYRDDGGFQLRTSGSHRTLDELRAAQEADPSVLSPNVLLRPVVESTVFPTLAYVAGPGEIAYFAQVGSYFEAHGIDMPIVYPRWAVTIVETKIGKVLDKFGMGPDDLRRPFHEIASDIAREEVPGDVRAAIGGLRGAVGNGVGALQQAASKVDPTLKGPVQHLRSQCFAAIDDVEKKILQAVKRENEIALAQLEKAQLHLYPYGKPAERVQSPLYYLARYGGALLDDLYERFEVNLD